MSDSFAPEQMPGTPENLAGLARLLHGWACCGAPSLCGATCMDDEISDTLARAARVVAKKVTGL